jgi:ferredoxin-NADP reductase
MNSENNLLGQVLNTNIRMFKIKLLKKEWLTQDIMKMSFSAPKDFVFKAGQFINIHIVRGEEKRYKAYSILNPPDKKGVIDLGVKIIPGGFASEKFLEAEEGDEFLVKGPFGHFVFSEKNYGDEYCFIATGIGIAPFYSILNEHLPQTKKNICLLFGVKTRQDLLFHEEFLELEKRHIHFEYKPVLSREKWEERTGRVQDHLGRCYKCGLEEEFKKKTYYICGQKNMVEETKKLLLERGTRQENIKIERFS